MIKERTGKVSYVGLDKGSQAYNGNGRIKNIGKFVVNAHDHVDNW